MSLAAVFLETALRDSQPFHIGMSYFPRKMIDLQFEDRHCVLQFFGVFPRVRSLLTEDIVPSNTISNPQKCTCLIKL